MTFEVERKRVGRQPFRFVKLHIDYCQNTYSTSPCAAGKINQGNLITSALGTAIVLSGSELTTDDIFNGYTLRMLDGPAAGEERVITDYVGSTKTATIASAFSSTPAPANSYIIPNGNAECHNTRATCQDTTNYNADPDTNVIYLTEKTEVVPQKLKQEADAMVVLPCINKINTAPSKITLAKGLGHRANLSVVCSDFPHHDRGVDKYVSQRNYDPSTRSTFFRKFLARNPYFLGRKAVLYSGYLVDGEYDATNFTSQTFFIEKILGPDKKESVTISCQDIIRKLDDDRAQWPKPSTGELDAGISAGAGAFTLQVGAGAQYANGDVVRIGEELIEIVTIAGDTASAITRGVWGSIASAHEVGDTVQKCAVFQQENVTDIIQTLVTQGGGLSTSFIDTVSFAVEKVGLLAGNNLTTVISEPTGINTLLTEISKENFLFMWWDDRGALLRIKAIVPEVPTKTLNDSINILSGSAGANVDLSGRISEYQMRYAVSDQTQQGDENLYRKLFISAATTLSGPDKYGEDKIVRVQSRWFDDTNDALASQTANRHVTVFGDAPYIVEFELDAKDEINLGDNVRAYMRNVVDVFGEILPIDLIIIEKREIITGTTFGYLAHQLNVSSIGIARVAPAGTVDYEIADDTIKENNAFIAPSSGVFADGRTAYKVY